LWLVILRAENFSPLDFVGALALVLPEAAEPVMLGAFVCPPGPDWGADIVAGMFISVDVAGISNKRFIIIAMFLPHEQIVHKSLTPENAPKRLHIGTIG